MMNLFDISDAYLSLLNLEFEDESIKGHFENLDEAFEDKADQYAYVIKELDGREKTIQNEIARLNDLLKSTRNRKKAVQKNLEENMLLVGKRKFKTELNSFYIQKNRASVHIIDEDKIPEDYWKIERKPIKADIEEALKQGLLTDCAELVQTESLRIR